MSIGEEIIYEDDQGNYIAQKIVKDDHLYQYLVYDNNDVLAGTLLGEEDLGALTEKQLRKTDAFNILNRVANGYTRSNAQNSIFSKMRNSAQSYPTANYWGAYYQPKTGYVDRYCNSDTLVFHKADHSTDMLSQIYDGKGWDVITDTNIAPEELRELIEKHDRIVCLGHGTPGGLIGGNITSREAPYLKGKKVFAIWCYAATFFKRNGLTGQGIFCTDNCPSEKVELDWVGIKDKNYTDAYVLENITYYCGLCADVVEQALEGDPEGAVEYVRKKYLEKFGHDGMTDFNANTLQVV